MKRKSNQQFKYDVCLSFAGDDRCYVKEVANNLNERGVKVFYDEYERAELWGKDLYLHFDRLYRSSARYCVIFISKNYAKKLWTNHECKSAQARAFRDNQENILPARFDKTAIPGIRETVGYIDLRATSPIELSKLIIDKLGPLERTAFLPSNPDRLFELFDSQSEDSKEKLVTWASGILGILTKMSAEERKVIAEIFDRGCTCELPENMHMPVDYLRRYSRVTTSKLKKIIEAVRSLGLVASFRRNDEAKYPNWGNLEVVVVKWLWSDSKVGGGNLTKLGHVMISELVKYYCEEHRDEAIQHLDFSCLANMSPGDSHQCRH